MLIWWHFLAFLEINLLIEKNKKIKWNENSDSLERQYLVMVNMAEMVSDCREGWNGLWWERIMVNNGRNLEMISICRDNQKDFWC